MTVDPAHIPQSVLLLGDYGSGKTEVAVNLSLGLAAAVGPGKVTIADLDLVNPYFRCREAHEPMEQAGIKVLMPGGEHQFADLPILMPGVKGLLQSHGQGERAVLDVGGDEVGSRVLSALEPVIDGSRHGVWFVLNMNRPFCDTAEGCLKIIRGIEGSSSMEISGLVANTHLMAETTAEMIRQGARLSREVAGRLGVPLCLVGAMEPLADQLKQEDLGAPLLPMRRLMVPPWQRRPAGLTGPEVFRGA